MKITFICGNCGKKSFDVELDLGTGERIFHCRGCNQVVKVNVTVIKEGEKNE